MGLKSVRKRGYHVSTNGIGVWVPVARADDGILLVSTIADDPSRRFQPEQVRHLAGSGPQLAYGQQNVGSPGALDAGRRRRGFHGVQGRSG